MDVTSKNADKCKIFRNAYFSIPLIHFVPVTALCDQLDFSVENLGIEIAFMLIYLPHSLQTPWIKLSSKTIKKSNQSTARIQQCKTLTDALRYIAGKNIGEEKGRKYLVHTQEKRRTGTENNSRRKIFCLLRRIRRSVR